MLNVARWPLVAVIMVRALATLYHVVAGRPGLPQVEWGPIIGASLWLLASGLFALYTGRRSPATGYLMGSVGSSDASWEGCR